MIEKHSYEKGALEIHQNVAILKIQNVVSVFRAPLSAVIKYLLYIDVRIFLIFI